MSRKERSSRSKAPAASASRPLEALAEAMRRLQARLDSARFSPGLYRRAGVFVLRRAVAPSRLAAWQAAWSAFCRERLESGRKTDPFNPVVVQEEVPPALAAIHASPDLIRVMRRLYPDLALYVQRFLVKDRQSRTPVFLHHDFGYDSGWPEKTSVFLALSAAGPENGGLGFYPGTHAFGYWGDVGEFDPEVLGPRWPVLRPRLEPGDAVLMHECTWHASTPHVAGPDRVLVQITYQPADDPSGVALLHGRWRTPVRLSDLSGSGPFRRSRSSRLRELQAELRRLKPEPAAETP